MKVLITAGGTSEYIDSVRSITNKSTGYLGKLVAEEFSRVVDDVQIYYVCSKTAVIPDVRNCNIIQIINVNDVLEVLLKLFGEIQFDVIIHAMAVSDYTISNVISIEHFVETLERKISNKECVNRKKIEEILLSKEVSVSRNKKIDSSQEILMLTLKKTVKIISLIRENQPDAVIVGFKLMSNVRKDVLVHTAYNLLVSNNCDFVFANDLKNIIGLEEHIGYLVGREQLYCVTKNKKEAAEKIVENVIKYLDTGRVRE